MIGGIRLFTVGPPESYGLIHFCSTQFMFGIAFWKMSKHDSIHIMVGPLQFEWAWLRKMKEPR